MSLGTISGRWNGEAGLYLTLAIRKRWLLLAAAVLIATAVTGVWVIQSGAQSGSVAASPSIRTVLEVISLIKTQYVDDVDALDLIAGYVEKGTINGMLEATLDDPYTRYMEPHAYEQMQIDTEGEYGGIGIMVGLKKDEATGKDRLTIIAPFEGTPGHAAGLRSGDWIVSIDGRPTDLMSLDEAVSLMRGPEGAPLVLGVQRRGGEPFEVNIVRATIQVPSVTRVEFFPRGAFTGQDHAFGYIRLQRFSERTDAELLDALNTLDRQRAAGLILDLRDNPGGTLSAAIDVANRFLPDGPILHIVGRDQAKRTIYAFERGTHPPIALVILVNGYSASASEIVSGALQDRGYAKLVGTTTFGKGLVQTVIPLRDGSAVSLTSARYQTAGGRFIHETGIEPDVVVELPEDWGIDEEISPLSGGELASDPQFLKAVEVLMGEIGRSERKAG